MTRRAGKYRHVRPLPGLPLTHHALWVCIGCGHVEWLADSSVQRKRHCLKGCWTLFANLTEIGVSAEVAEAAHRVGGASALYDIIKHARAQHGLETETCTVALPDGGYATLD